LTQHGFAVVCPDIYQQYGQGQPAQVAAAAREAGGVPDDSVMADCAASLEYLINQPAGNGRVGVMGMCSGGRHAFLAACTVPGFAAAVDCWGGGVIAAPGELTPARPVAPIDFASQLACPLLGIFGNDDKYPTPDVVDQQAAVLTKYGKSFEFHRYDGAGHAMWNYAGESYRPTAAMDSWNKVLAFLAEHLRT